MIKGDSMKKKIFIIIGVLLCLLLFSLFFFLFFKDENKTDNNDLSYEERFKNKGYSDDEIANILDKVSKDDYELILETGYDMSLIDSASALARFFSSNEFL